MDYHQYERQLRHCSVVRPDRQNDGGLLALTGFLTLGLLLSYAVAVALAAILSMDSFIDSLLSYSRRWR
jgi:hypothetical protein